MNSLMGAVIVAIAAIDAIGLEKANLNMDPSAGTNLTWETQPMEADVQTSAPR